MRLLLDSQILVAILHSDIAALPAIETVLQSSDNQMVVSAVSLWELAIKYRLGKLNLERPPGKLPVYVQSLGYLLLAVDHRHAIEDLKVAPPTRDPFDRMLLAQCQVEGLRLITIDRALVDHPLAWRAP
jgi:PIN domain nuclease of toxin-antitoxin system